MKRTSCTYTKHEKAREKTSISPCERNIERRKTQQSEDSSTNYKKTHGENAQAITQQKAIGCPLITSCWRRVCVHQLPFLAQRERNEETMQTFGRNPDFARATWKMQSTCGVSPASLSHCFFSLPFSPEVSHFQAENKKKSKTRIVREKKGSDSFLKKEKRDSRSSKTRRSTIRMREQE